MESYLLPFQPFMEPSLYPWQEPQSMICVRREPFQHGGACPESIICIISAAYATCPHNHSFRKFPPCIPHGTEHVRFQESAAAPRRIIAPSIYRDLVFWKGLCIHCDNTVAAASHKIAGKMQVSIPCSSGVFIRH